MQQVGDIQPFDALSTPVHDGLNPPQREAVHHTEGPLLVLAGAGTGKTRVLTARIAHILELGLARPFEILAVTFTNKASNEMKERVMHALGHTIDGLWLGTFHSLGLKMLRRHGDEIGLRENFTILDQDDQLRLIKQLLKVNHIDEKQTAAKMVQVIINKWKDKGLTPENVPQYDRNVIWDIYQQYQDRMMILNAVDFGDLLLHCLTLFKKKPEILAKYQRQFRYIHVDEYQDTNVTQYLWLRLLCQVHENICCVGDDDQSIYGWRGAEVGNILKFEQDFPTAHVVKLEQNYRSTSNIIKTAAHLISKNKERLGKTLWTDKEEGEKILIRGTWDAEDEARFIGDEVEELERKKVSLREIAVLMRAGFQTREFEERFLQIGIPYKVVGGFRFYERLEIKDAIAYIRLILQPDDALAFERIVNLPKRGVGETTVQKMHSLARDENISLPKAAEIYANNIAKGQIRLSLLHFFKQLEKWRLILQTGDIPHVELVKSMLDESGYTTMWMEDKSPDSPGRLENLRELVSALESFDTLQGFLEHVSLVMDNHQNESIDQVTLMTLHAAKGLEYKFVFLSGWEEGLFPHSKAIEENGEAGIEEERRLGYVGISRAKERAVITYAKQRRIHGRYQNSQPSRFIKELPKEHIIKVSPTGAEQTHLSNNSVVTFTSTGKSHNFDVKDRIFHEKFGYGTVLDLDVDYLTIQFDTGSVRQVLAAYVDFA
ncbi:MAG: UvrD-helicase domain-containing protein [Proteobacteria bacterium]|nr:UvrD-helicase domain-containing protein [Pseudomonadota bacterium]